MAKNGISKARNWILTIIGCMTLAGMFTVGVLAWGDLGDKIDDQAVIINNRAEIQESQYKQVVDDADNLEVEGCKPAQKNGSSIELIEYRLDEMQITQRAIQSDTKEILKRLPK